MRAISAMDPGKPNAIQDVVEDEVNASAPASDTSTKLRLYRSTDQLSVPTTTRRRAHDPSRTPVRRRGPKIQVA